jgi:tRNA/tmRNA/rRNA uracil-C5-methylase (TrmA/RlmC/RlmD family)
VRPDTFWQAHSLAAETLVAAVLDGVVPRRGEGAFDLYCGVGLFAGALLDAGCRVWGVDANASAIELAKNNLIDAGDRVTLRTDRVERALRRLPRRADLIVLDPPRTGAGRAVMELIASRAPRAIAYVACDPAALARDLGTIGHTGYYSVTSIRAFDLFPMTAQVECVAIIERDPGAGKGRVRGR